MSSTHLHPTAPVRCGAGAGMATRRIAAQINREIDRRCAERRLAGTSADVVDAALARIKDDSYDSQARRDAIAAVDAGRAAVLTTGRHHNHAAANAAYEVNRGVSTVAAHALRWARDRGVGAAERYVVNALVALNEAGERQLEEARWALADMRGVAQAAE